MRTRIGNWFRTKKRRLLYIFLVIALFQVIDNFIKIFGSRYERFFKKYKKIMLEKYHIVPSNLEMNYQPKSLSRPSTNKLGEKFVRIDRAYKSGFTRQMIMDLVNQCGKSNDQNFEQFMAKCPYINKDECLASGWLMQDFYELIENSISVSPESGSTDEL